MLPKVRKAQKDSKKILLRCLDYAPKTLVAVDATKARDIQFECFYCFYPLTRDEPRAPNTNSSNGFQSSVCRYVNIVTTIRMQKVLAVFSVITF